MTVVLIVVVGGVEIAAAIDVQVVRVGIRVLGRGPPVAVAALVVQATGIIRVVRVNTVFWLASSDSSQANSNG